jgi:hypothetical protein
MRRSLLSLVATASVVLAVAGALGWDLSGGRLLVMETPSMCPVVCVGSLVADRPLEGPLHVGELITFHPPGSAAETYTHEVSQIFPNGMIQTRGVANPNHDPWLITRADIVGVTAFTVWGLGWLLKILPLLAVGLVIWLVARRFIARRSRRAWDRVWVTSLAVVPLWLLHPLVRGSVISTVPDTGRAGWLRGTVLNTGILPTSFAAAHGEVVAHVPSTSSVQVTGPSTGHGYLVIREAVSLPWWGWALVALIVASPLLGYLWHLVRDDEVVSEASERGSQALAIPGRRERRGPRDRRESQSLPLELLQSNPEQPGPVEGGQAGALVGAARPAGAVVELTDRSV